MASNSRNSGMNIARVDDDDRISNLPCEVLVHILQLLLLKDAVRTSILSTNWRSKWTMLPKLVLDRRFFSHVLKFDCPCILHQCLGDREPLNVDYTRVCSVKMENFVPRSEVVSSMLARLVGPIRSFTLRIPHWFPEDADVVIDQWVQFVSGKFVKKFTITHDLGFSIDKCWELPMSVFNPMGFNDLTHLTIINFGLPSIPTTFKGFPCLVSLDVRHRMGGELSSGTAHVLGILVSKCPQLKSLDSYIYDVEGCLTIRAPKLRNFCIGGALYGLCFKETKKMEVFNIFNLGIVFCDTLLMEWFSSLPLLRSLVLGFSFMEKLPRNGRLLKPPCELGQLKHLRLAGLHLDNPFAISFILILFKVASNLQKLELHLWDNTRHSQRSLGDMIDENDCCLEHLKAVRVSFLVHTSGDILLQFIKLILSSSPVLEVMTVEASVCCKQLNLHQLLQCPRASANAKIIIKT